LESKVSKKIIQKLIEQNKLKYPVIYQLINCWNAHLQVSHCRPCILFILVFQFPAVFEVLE